MTRVACIDVGTVSCRLAVAEVVGGRVARLDKTSVICDLGEGLSATGRVSDAARGRVVACVRDFARVAHAAGASATCCTLTSAARDARNADALTDELRRLGVSPQVIPGDVEGMLTFAGVAADHVGAPLLVADNGGGSTELAAGTLGADGTLDLAFVESVDVGCRRVTERFLSADAPDAPASVDAARCFVRGLLAPAVERARAAADLGTLVVCGGTATSLVAMRDELVPYDSARVHGARLLAADVEGLLSRLAALPVAERASVAGLQAKRAPVIVGGVVCVSELLRATGLPSLVVSEHDLLYGLALAVAAVAEGVESGLPWAPEVTRDAG